MDLSMFPRRRYTAQPTPIEHLERLSRHLGGPEIYIKRDDMLGLAGGGNKTRKLEFLVADAIAKGADTLITVGAVQSNHCRLTLAAANKEGLKCHLVIEERVSGSYDAGACGNNLLFHLLGVESITVVSLGTDLESVMKEVQDQLASEGRKGYIIPGGGSNALGALGYVACAFELLSQCFDQGISLDHLVCASGSGGTHAGLLVGLRAANSTVPLIGISVRAGSRDQQAKLYTLASAIAAELQLAILLEKGDIEVVDDYVGAGYSIPTDEMIEAVQLFARLEGILLDPVYTGKAAAGLIGQVRSGRFSEKDRVLLLHTGGAPALHAYAGQFLG